MATSDNEEVGMKKEEPSDDSSSFFMPTSSFKPLAPKVAQVEAGDVGEQAAGLALHFLFGQLGGGIQGFVNGRYHEVGEHFAVFGGEQRRVDVELHQVAVAVGGCFYEATACFAGSGEVLKLRLGLLHFVLQLLHFAHHAHHVECHSVSYLMLNQ
jgi:hypothetical protein